MFSKKVVSRYWLPDFDRAIVKMYLVVTLLSTFIFPTETAVSVTVESGLIGQDAVECGQNDKIKCVVSPFPGTAVMYWNTDTKPLTQCFPGSDNDCSLLTVDHYEFTSKPAEETFNLTFNPVKFSDGSVEFICTDTGTPASVSPSVKVLPDASTTTIMNSSDTEITVTTGCVYPPNEVTFQWMYYSVNEVESDAVSYEYGSSSVKTETSTTCADPDCGGTDVKPRSSTLTFEKGQVAGNYHFKAVISHAASSGTVAKTIGPFKLDGGSTTTSSTNTSTSSNTTTPTVNASTTSTATNPPTTTAKTTCDNTCIIVIGVCLFVILLALFFVCCLLRHRRNKKKKDKSKETNSSQSCDNDINL